MHMSSNSDRLILHSILICIHERIICLASSICCQEIQVSQEDWTSQGCPGCLTDHEDQPLIVQSLPMMAGDVFWAPAWSGAYFAPNFCEPKNQNQNITNVAAQFLRSLLIDCIYNNVYAFESVFNEQQHFQIPWFLTCCNQVTHTVEDRGVRLDRSEDGQTSQLIES